MKKDIESREDIELMVRTFYTKVRSDELIAHFFTQVVDVNWNQHLPVMFDFWEQTLFHKGTYGGHPIEVHRNIHNISRIEPVHFERWVQLFHLTMDELFEGPHAERGKQRGQSMATMMMLKLST